MVSNDYIEIYQYLCKDANVNDLFLESRSDSLSCLIRGSNGRYIVKKTYLNGSFNKMVILSPFYKDKRKIIVDTLFNACLEDDILAFVEKDNNNIDKNSFDVAFNIDEIVLLNKGITPYEYLINSQLKYGF